MASREIYEIVVYDPSQALSRIKEHGLTVYHFHEVQPYHYQFATLPGSQKKVRMLFGDAVLIRRSGVYASIYHLWKRKTTLIALIIAIVAFFFFSDRIYEVEVIGSSRTITAQVEDELKRIGLCKGARKPNYDHLLSYEKTLQQTFSETIEFLELRMVGVQLRLRYQKRREAIDLPTKTGKMYAKKRGIISHFVISSGQICVKENQYVQEGDLLVDDAITTPDGESITIGAEGQVYAWTWTIIKLDGPIGEREEASEVYARFSLEAQTMMAAGFYLEERIEKAIILRFEITDRWAYFEIHFTCLEDIAN